jgi:hypothetical protein
MSKPFSEMFRREFPSRLKEVKTFDELKQNFKGWGKEHAPMTNKQNRALAVEARGLGIKNVSYQIRYADRYGKQQIRYKDTITGIWTRPDGTFSKKEGKKK